jgi:hypothetical protein
MIASARRGSWPPTMLDLDATNIIWRPIDRCRMRRKRMSRRSHRKSALSGPTRRSVLSQSRLPGPTPPSSRRGLLAAHRIVALQPMCAKTVHRVAMGSSIYRRSSHTRATCSSIGPVRRGRNECNRTSSRVFEGCRESGCQGDRRGRAVSVRALHFTQLLTGFPAFHAHGSNSSRRLTGCPAIMRESTSWR